MAQTQSIVKAKVIIIPNQLEMAKNLIGLGELHFQDFNTKLIERLGKYARGHGADNTLVISTKEIAKQIYLWVFNDLPFSVRKVAQNNLEKIAKAITCDDKGDVVAEIESCFWETMIIKAR